MLFFSNTWLPKEQGLVQLVSASSPSHQVLGSKPSLCRISSGVRLCFGYSFPQTPLVWEPLTLGLPFLQNDPPQAPYIILLILVGQMATRLSIHTQKYKEPDLQNPTGDTNKYWY
jgi:hypothetical protein